MSCDRGAQREGASDLERKRQARELPGEPVEVVHLTAQQDAVADPLEDAGGGEELAPGGREIGLEQRLNGECPGQRRDRELQVTERVEPLRP